MDTTSFKTWIGATIHKIFLKVWPPKGEEKISDIDMTLCLCFAHEPDSMIEIYRDICSVWEPVVEKSTLPAKVYPWDHFEQRMQKWMTETMDSKVTHEYYEANSSDYFRTMIGDKIKQIDLLYSGHLKMLFGLKVYTSDDYMLSLPNADGSILSTKKFNKNDKLMSFECLGKITCKSIA